MAKPAKASRLYDISIFAFAGLAGVHAKRPVSGFPELDLFLD